LYNKKKNNSKIKKVLKKKKIKIKKKKHTHSKFVLPVK